MPQVLHNALRRITAIQRAYRNALGSNDDPSFKGIERAGETITPVMNLWDRPEWAFLRDESLFWVTPSVAAVVGEFQQVGIRNPTGSNAIMVIEQMNCQDSGGTGRLMEARIRAQGTVDATSTPLGRDTRLPDFTNGISNAVSIATSGVAVLGTLVARFWSTSSTPGFVNFPCVLTPGFELLLGSASNNISIFGTFVGRVRQALPGEL